MDANTVEYTIKQAGKVTSNATTTVSPDGKTLTMRIKGTNAQGQPTDIVQVRDKQSQQRWTAGGQLAARPISSAGEALRNVNVSARPRPADCYSRSPIPDP